MEQQTRNESVVVGATSVQCCQKVTGKLRRVQLVIGNTSAAATVTLVLGPNPAVAGAGIRLSPGGQYLESTDSGFQCWNYEVQVIADAAGTVSVVERLVED